jgi:hypothetical protein
MSNRDAGLNVEARETGAGASDEMGDDELEAVVGGFNPPSGTPLGIEEMPLVVDDTATLRPI